MKGDALRPEGQTEEGLRLRPREEPQGKAALGARLEQGLEGGFGGEVPGETIERIPAPEEGERPLRQVLMVVATGDGSGGCAVRPAGECLAHAGLL